MGGSLETGFGEDKWVEDCSSEGAGESCEAEGLCWFGGLIYTCDASEELEEEER